MYEHEGDTSMSSRCERFKTLISQYADHMVGDVFPVQDVDQQREIRQQEYSDVMCVVFYNHWIYQDLDNVVDPRSGVQTPDARTAAARGYGLVAYGALADFLDIVEGVTT
ncbi:hypothetical protein B0J14DRAFT_570001 [Halenospora varia]|nr:hypothetical protein B0J14DRAFT_570001 [Halenospora varia]